MSASELDYITIKGFKSIASIEKLRLRAINVVIGPNGSGKSNFIGVFAFLHAIREGHLQDYVIRAGGADKLLHFGSRITKMIGLEISFEKGVNQYKIELGVTNDQLYRTGEAVRFWDQKSPTPFSNDLPPLRLEAGISNPNCKGVARYVRERLDRWRLYHFHDTSSTSPMKKAAALNDNHYLRPDGSNLASFLFYLRERHENSYGLIRRTVQRVAPFFDDFQLQPARLSPDTIRLEWRHMNSEAYFDAASLSDGTLRFIALATLFLQPEEYRPSVILIDEPELGLHPYAITMLASLVKQASLKTQVIMGTQSPLLLDHFQPEDVLVANRVKAGTEFTRLDPNKLAAWLEDYSLGQLWEKNELGGRPASE